MMLELIKMNFQVLFFYFKFLFCSIKYGYRSHVFGNRFAQEAQMLQRDASCH